MVLTAYYYIRNHTVKANTSVEDVEENGSDFFVVNSTTPLSWKKGGKALYVLKAVFISTIIPN